MLTLVNSRDQKRRQQQRRKTDVDIGGPPSISIMITGATMILYY